MTLEEARQEMNSTLDRLGMTLSDLKDQARAGKFSTERARWTWDYLEGLGLVSS